MFQRHLKGENAVTDEGELITKEGTVVPVIISASLTTVGGKPVLQGIFHDISERKRIDQERQESELRFRQVTENVEEVFWISSPDWNEIIYISPAYEKIWGRTCASLYEEPRSWLDAVVEEDKEALRADIEKKSSGDLSEAEMPEYRIVRPDGSMRWILARAFPIMDDEGNINRIAGIAEDITERKIAEEEVRKSEMKYRQLSESLEETVRQKVAALEQAERLAAIGQMVSVVAHEIKNPLQNIRMGADALSRALTDDTDKMEILEEINYGVTLLNRIIGELSEYAKPVDLEFTSLSVGSLIDNVVKRLSHTLGKITVHKALEGEDRKILVDATKFGQTLVNVISNAVDALPDGGNIWIESRFHEFDGREVLTLSIRDDGAGIDEEELPNVYRPFFTTKTRGTGLGIPICMKIMAAHNGNLSITSVVDTGTTVEITLPSGSPADEKS
jgi:PAS domain S-box-containing protein